MSERLTSVEFQVSADEWGRINEGTQRWHAVLDNVTDDRVYSLHFGMRSEHGVWESDVQDLVFVKTPNEKLVFEVVAIHFEKWAPGWLFIQFASNRDLPW